MATECIICTFPFDDGEFKPVTGFCGHTLCLKCYRTLPNKKCPMCQRQDAFRAEIVSFQMIELVEVCKGMKAEKECSNQNRDKYSECGSSMEKQKSRLCSSCCSYLGIVAFHRENLKILDVTQTDKFIFCADCALDGVHKGHDIILYAPLKKRHDVEEHLGNLSVASLARPLVEVVRVLLWNFSYEPKWMSTSRWYKSLISFIPQSKLRLVKLYRPRIVCYSFRCATLGGSHNTHRRLKTCHEGILKGTQGISVASDALKGSPLFRNGLCRGCGCSHAEHMYVTYDLQEGAQYGIVSALKFRQMHNDVDRLRKFIVEASVFCSNYQTDLASDPFMDYPKFLGNFQNLQTWGRYMTPAALKCFRIESEIKQLKTSIQQGRRNALTPIQMKEMVNDLRKMDVIGPILETLKSWGVLELPRYDEDAVGRSSVQPTATRNRSPISTISLFCIVLVLFVATLHTFLLRD